VGTYNASTLPIKALLVNTSGSGTLYTYSAVHDFKDDVPTASIFATSSALTSKTFTSGVFDADNVTFTAVTASANTIEAIILYGDTAGADSTDPLIAYLDTGITGLPTSPNGGDITITWDVLGILGL
jgi:hypothetical protein